MMSIEHMAAPEPWGRSDQAGARVVAVIPAYNAERFIGSGVLAAVRQVDRVIVVDGGSTDRTAALAEAAGAWVIRLGENPGIDAALKVGVDQARRLHPQAVVILDADSRHDPGEIPGLVGPIIEERADVVIGSPLVGGGSAPPWWRRIGDVPLNALTKAAGRVGVRDSPSGYRALSPAALPLIASAGGWGVEPGMQGVLRESGLRTVAVPVHGACRERAERLPLKHGLAPTDRVLALVAQRRPILFFAAPGVVLALSGVALGTAVVGTVGQAHRLPVGMALLTTMLVLGGALLGIAGVILHSMDYLSTRMEERIARSVERVIGGFGND